MMDKLLLTFGLIFPTLSWLSFIQCSLQYFLKGKTSSGAYIPFIGPILIDIWIIKVGAPLWTMAIPWVADIGTGAFLWVLPRLILEQWQTSTYTRLFLLAGAVGNQSVEISFHKGGHYLMRKTWQRAPNEFGITSLSEPERFVTDEAAIILTSHSGRKRNCRKESDDFRVEDTESSHDYSIHNWFLKRTDG